MLKQGIFEIIKGASEGFKIAGEVIAMFGNAVAWAVSLLVSWLFIVTGGEDKIISCLLIVMCLDYATGLLKAVYNKETNSQKGFRGFLKKVLILCVVVLAYRLDITFNMQDFQYNCRFVTICFYIANESLSILENAINCGLKVPQQLKNVLEQCKNKEIKR
jgi:toxin secretion/phage lysis holin